MVDTSLIAQGISLAAPTIAPTADPQFRQHHTSSSIFHPTAGNSVCARVRSIEVILRFLGLEVVSFLLQPHLFPSTEFAIVFWLTYRSHA